MAQAVFGKTPGKLVGVIRRKGKQYIEYIFTRVKIIDPAQHADPDRSIFRAVKGSENIVGNARWFTNILLVVLYAVVADIVLEQTLGGCSDPHIVGIGHQFKKLLLYPFAGNGGQLVDRCFLSAGVVDTDQFEQEEVAHPYVIHRVGDHRVGPGACQ